LNQTGNIEKKDYSVSMLQANIYALIMTAPFLLIFVAAYGLLWGWVTMLEQWGKLFNGNGSFLIIYLLFLLVLLVGTVFHELIHGITWVLVGRKNWSSIKFGFQASTLTPYCHIKEPMLVNPYRWGAVMPGIITGFLPALVGLLTGSPAVFLIGLFFVFAAGGDLLILWLIRKVEKSALVEDHPTRAGCYVLISQD
jgi:hypothetical protein